jgi:hypothetical protein
MAEKGWVVKERGRRKAGRQGEEHLSHDDKSKNGVGHNEVAAQLVSSFVHGVFV